MKQVALSSVQRFDKGERRHGEIAGYRTIVHIAVLHPLTASIGHLLNQHQFHSKYEWVVRLPSLPVTKG